MISHLTKTPVARFAAGLLTGLMLLGGPPLEALQGHVVLVPRESPPEWLAPWLEVGHWQGRWEQGAVPALRPTGDPGFSPWAQFLTPLRGAAFQALDSVATIFSAPNFAASGQDNQLEVAAEKSVESGQRELPLRRVERQARRAEAGSLPTLRSVESAVVAAPPQRIAAGSHAIAPEIVALAESLGNSPAAIYAAVYDQVDFDPKWGADSPPLQTWWEKTGTSWDQAWLLQELLVAAGVDARLEWGEVEVSPELLTEIAGVEDPLRAGDLMATAGQQILLVLGGNRVLSARFQHVWVKAFLDFEPDRGIENIEPDTWIRLDPSLKLFDRDPGTRYDQLVPFELGQHLTSGTTESPRATYESALLAYAVTHGGPATLGELAATRSLRAEAFPYVPGTLRVKVLSLGGEAAEVPANRQVQAEVKVRSRDGQLLSWTGPVSSTVGQNFELRWRGATSADQATLDLYGGVFAAPPYEVDLAPELRLGNAVLAVGGRIGSAEDAELSVTLTPPGGQPEVATWDLFAGEQGAMVFDFGRTSQESIDRFLQQAAGSTDALGLKLTAAAATYLRQVGLDRETLAPLRWQRVLGLGAAVFAAQRGAVSTATDGTPQTFSAGPLSLELGAQPLALFPVDGQAVSTVPTLELLGAQSSVRAGEALSAVFGGEHVTAVDFLKRAVRVANQTLTRVDAGNLEPALGTAVLADDAETSIRAAVERGNIAWISQTQLEIGGWRTTGYILENPQTGAGAYLVNFERRFTPLDGAVEFHSPVDLGVITAPTPVVATIDVPGIETWTLATRPVDGETSTVIATGTGAVENRLLGEFDPTLLLNGLHDLVLTGVDAAGQTITGKISVSVEGGMKIGNFAIAFVDLEVELAGIPIQVIRGYDSRRKEDQGDFGYGWELELQQGVYRTNGPVGRNWRINSGTESAEGYPITLPCHTPQEIKGHTANLRLSDQEIYRFRPKVVDTAITGGGCFARVVFEFVDGPQPGAVLESLGGNEVFWANGSRQLASVDTLELYDVPKVRLTTRDGRVFELDRITGIQKVKDANENQLTFTPTSITHSEGLAIELVRDEQGRVTKVIDPDGNELLYSYDAAGDLIRFEDRDNAVTQFTYNGHYLDSIIDPLGRIPIRNEYGPDGRLTKNIDAFGREIVYGHQLELNQELVTNRLGKSRLLEYDERGNVTREVNEAGEVTLRTYDLGDNLLTETDPLGNTTTNTYSNENLTSTTDPLGNVSRFSYNQRGDLLTMTDPLGNVTTNTHDAKGNLTSTTDALGNRTTYTYDYWGRELTETDAQGNVTSTEYGDFRYGPGQEYVTNALGHQTLIIKNKLRIVQSERQRRTLPDGTIQDVTTRYQYSLQGKLLSTTAADGTVTRTEYDPAGQATASIDALGRRTTFSYDALGRQTKVTHPDGFFEEKIYDAENRVLVSKDRAGNATTYSYDDTGRLLATTYPDGAVTRSVYDAAGRLTQSIDARGKVTTFEYDNAGRRKKVINALGFATEFGYDAAGNQTWVKDAKGNVTTFAYDSLSRQIRMVYADGTESQTGYDSLGRRVSETDQAGKITRFGYDALGRLTSVTDALNQITSYGYDELGNRVSQTDANGNVTRFEYDKIGRQTKRTLPGGAFETFTYRNDGQMASRTDFNGATITYSYDTMNRLIGRNYPIGETVGFTYNALGQRQTAVDSRGITSYGYDIRNRLESLTYPDGRRLEYTYDANGNRSSLNARVGSMALETTYTYDDLNRLQTVSDPEGRNTVYNYDQNGNREGLIHASGVVTNYVYDPLNRLKNITAISAVGSTVASFAYSLGPTGNRTRIVEHDGTVKNYDYDDLYRLTAETVTQGGAPRWSNTFAYDPVGNRLSQNRVETSGATRNVAYTYDQRDRLTTEDTFHYGWDPNGNLISKTGSDGATYEWDFENRLKKVTLASGMTVEHTYDIDGTRVKTVTTPADGPAQVVEYLVDPGGGLSQVVLEGSSTTNISAYYVRGDDLISVIRPRAEGRSEIKHYHADGLGSIRVLTDASGAVTDTWQFEAFGEVATHTGSDPNAYLFAGEMLDPNIGWSYNRARWMDPRTGRFGSMDPFAGRTQDPLSLHRYLYAGLNPVTNRDPTGWESLASLSIGSVMTQILAPMAIFSVLGAITGVADAWLGGEPLWPAARDGFIFGLGLGLGWRYRAWRVFATYLMLVSGGIGAVTSFQSGKVAQGVFRIALVLLMARSVLGQAKPIPIRRADPEGIARIRWHLERQVGDDAHLNMANRAAIERLEQGHWGRGDQNYYNHELLEARLMESGMPYQQAHQTALSELGHSPFEVYPPEVISRFPDQFNKNWRQFWNIPE